MLAMGKSEVEVPPDPLRCIAHVHKAEVYDTFAPSARICAWRSVVVKAQPCSLQHMDPLPSANLPQKCNTSIMPDKAAGNDLHIPALHLEHPP